MKDLNSFKPLSNQTQIKMDPRTPNKNEILEKELLKRKKNGQKKINSKSLTRKNRNLNKTIACNKKG